jgi:hypothetical protein
MNDCLSCGERVADTCTYSEVECGHHCNHSWTHDACCWCGRTWGEVNPKENGMDTITPQNAENHGEFGQFRKTALSRISNFTVPAGTRFETPEGLHAEDEEARIAFDAQGGVYPIRESVFQSTYEPAE